MGDDEIADAVALLDAGGDDARQVVGQAIVFLGLAVDERQAQIFRRIDGKTAFLAALDPDPSREIRLRIGGRGLHAAKAHVQELCSIREACILVRRAEDDGDQLDTAAPRRGREAAARRVRVARLDARRALVSREQAVRVRHQGAFLLGRDPGDLTLLRADEGAKLRVLHAVGGDACDVVRRRDVRRIGQAVRIDEVRVLRADGLRLLVHVRGEAADRAGEVFGNGDGGTVVRAQHHLGDELGEYEAIACADLRIFRFCRRAAHGEDGREIALLDGEHACHHLRRARRKTRHIRRFLVEHAPRRSLDENCRGRCDLYVFRRTRLRCEKQEDEDAEGKDSLEMQEKASCRDCFPYYSIQREKKDRLTHRIRRMRRFFCFEATPPYKFS